MAHTTHYSSRMIGVRSYLHFIRGYRLKLLVVLVLFFSANILLALIPIFIGGLVTAISSKVVHMDIAWQHAWILIALSSFHDIAWRMSELAYLYFLNEIPNRYETHIFQAVARKPYAYFVDKLTGKIGGYVTNLGTEFRRFIEVLTYDSSGHIVGLGTTIFILATLNWQSVAIFITGLVGMFIVGRSTLRKSMKLESVATDIASSKNGILYDAIANYPSVKAFRATEAEVQTIAHEQEKAIAANKRASFSGIIFWASMSLFVRHFIWIAILLVNTWLFSTGKLSVGQFATLLSAILVFANTIWNAIWSISQLGQQFARINEAHEYLFGDAMPTSAAIPPIKNLTFQHTLRIENLSFAYPDKPETRVLKDITLSIRHGEKIGIVGHSGSGKSTLTKIMLGLYEAPPTSFFLDDVAVTTEQLSERMSYVPQDTALFHRSIADNIAYGNSAATQAKIEDAAKYAFVHDFILELPDGYNTLVGERGVKLSGGQRQRVAIARAILANKQILILDEATSALDSESEHHIQESLESLMKHRTSIVIAHRLSTLRAMDRILVMEKGRIVEEGTHDELLAKKGAYQKLWAHQSGGFIRSDT